jgi:hypothetical protein
VRRGRRWSASAVLALSVLFFAVAAFAADAGDDFRSLSTSERQRWLEQLESVLGKARRPESAPAAPQDLPAASAQGAAGKQTWHIDGDGFVVLNDGRRPMGSRVFARSCFLQHADSFQRWASAFSRNLKVAHLVATAITESGCSEWKGAESVDNLSTGLMQVTGGTCRNLLRQLETPEMSEDACLEKMVVDPDFSIGMAAALITQPDQVRLTELDPPKVAAVYNAGGLYPDSTNPWRLRATGNHIDRFVAAYNAYVAWEKEGGRSRSTRGAGIRLSKNTSLPRSVDRVEALQQLTPKAREGDIVFVGSWETQNGDYYVFVNGEWRGSLEDSGS